MQNQVLLFEGEALGTEVQRVWKQLTREQRKAVTILLATLMARSVASAQDDLSPVEAKEEGHD